MSSPLDVATEHEQTSEYELKMKQRHEIFFIKIIYLFGQFVD